jgi:hypothetical protein
MKRYLLDTAPLTAYLQKREPAVQLIQPFIKAHTVATSIIVYAEVVEYIKSLPNVTQRHYDLQQLLREIYPYFLIYSNAMQISGEKYARHMVKGSLVIWIP